MFRSPPRRWASPWSSGTSKNQGLAGNNTRSQWMAYGPSSAPPQIPKNQRPGHELVNGRGMNALSGGNQPVRKSHPPRQICGNSIIAITGDQAADPAYCVADG